MKRYPISKEYFPFNKFTPSVNRFVVSMSQLFMKVPHSFKKDKELNIEKITLTGYKDEKFDLYILDKKDLKDNSPAIIFIHGGGFIFEGTSGHYYLAKEYAKRCNCKVIYVRYNLSPKYPFPYPQIESYKAVQYVFEHTKELNIDINRIALTGDSAGAALCLSALLEAKEVYNTTYKPLFTVLIYPWLDGRGTSNSNITYKNTPMWNSSLSKKVGKLNNPNKIKFPHRYSSIIEDENIIDMPDSYIEVAEFDALHDDGVIYSEILKKNNKEVELYEVKGSMHGYDSKYKSPTVQKMFEQRIEYISRKFNK